MLNKSTALTARSKPPDHDPSSESATWMINSQRDNASETDAVQPECPNCSAREGAEMSRYSREMNKQFK